uniref:Small ribosomal subunit protein uS3c n=1 Tax=Capsosiphon fulvescens TaxID=205396 RepID=A0A3G5ART8_9CHLO|nr:ribosomal protein S3 [Capsosiphon fulvescens]AWX64077.1 ribosomal protein S3 [Capsosiphon fulvescens]AYV89994.1 ribosomal protein S3 [Capsosiphon fulvescens]
MGQKTHPLGFRLGVTQQHRSKWFANQHDYPFLILQDKLLREKILSKYPDANIVDIFINRRQTTQDLEQINLIEISIHTAVPGKIVDRSSKGTLNTLSVELESICEKQIMHKKNTIPKSQVLLSVTKVQNPYSSASIISDYLISQLEQRVPFRAALKKSLERIRLAKLEGVKIQVSGRLNGAEIARTEWVRKGRVPLQTLRADIDYASKSASTIYGILGIKVWTFKGELT